ncbi:MAG: bifunctional DNA-formamidopyrimidine glycosylase/DNA-(apurinic or apyrimidinic site) lyase [Pseudomonadales bacterium]|nr:bifunctional DNA-formamidopyrimidine glycosylase/DNA-(apurinic or apyrimidinic site) lyase [Pseudomonadales bacterium]MCP5183437.1 bifunctional DNA-formamidopyrimidine glycosylase/DNA-(apurinic or apyrimidinic site) lyase [Pseudomonadales bacterium]
MPELPEVETTLRGIAPHLEQQRLIAWRVLNSALRWPVDIPVALAGQVVLRLRRRGKYIIVEFAAGGMILHLGMSGSLRLVPRDTPLLKHDHVEWDFGGPVLLRLNDPRRFGCVLWQAGDVDTHRLLARLGPEPLGNAFSGDHLKELARGKRVAVKPFLMDAGVVVGVGNIYANEALHLAGVRPTRSVRRIPAARFDHIASAVRRVLAEAITQGGTTLRDFISPEGKPGYFRQRLLVYDRTGEPCRRCGSAIVGRVLGGRGTFYCPECQPSQGFGPAAC